jgi:iron complex outermembrane recepter protein
MMIEKPENSRTPLWRGMAPILAGLAFGMTPMIAVAQDEAQDEDQEEAQEAPDVERMVVTGSRLRTNANVVAPNPILSVGEGEIESRGTTRIEDLVNQLPQVFAGEASETSNGATGTATLDLRGLGAIRTLPLIDGRRLPFGASFISSPDINLVPTQLIERIDIVTGGASAVYGSDAVAGVANFILKRDFEGIEIDMQGSFNQSGNEDDFHEEVLRRAQQPIPGGSIDGRELQVSLTMGANSFDGKGNVTLFVNYENTNAITQDNRVESACALGATAVTLPDGTENPTGFRGVGCVGSGNFRAFQGLGASGLPALFQEADGTLVGFDSTNPNQTFNFGPRNFFQRPSERFQIYARGHYEITDDIEMFADLAFNNNKTDAQVAESATFGNWTINCDNPFIQPDTSPGEIPLTTAFGCQQDADGNFTGDVPVFASHRMVEGGPRSSLLDISSWRTIGGLRGTLLDDYDFEVFGQFARTLDKAISTGDLLIDNVQDAFFVVEDENGNPVCRSGNQGCVPLNIFERNPDGTTRVTQEAVDFVQGVGITTGEVQQWVLGGNVQTDLGRFGWRSPWADGGVGVLIGGEFRQDELLATPDEVSQRPDGGFTGVGGPTLPTSGEIRVSEVYMEAQIPLITGAPLFEQLSIGGAYRYSDYTVEDEDIENDFDTDTFHAFVNWTPIEDVRLRWQFQRAVRAPNVIELFEPQGTNLPDLTTRPNGLFDPCAGPNPFSSFEECARTGVTAEQFGNIPDVLAGQTQSITGGNPLLNPESSDTVTVGAILTPSFAPGLTVSVDYFNIEVDDAIAQGIPAQTTLDECLATGDPAFCGLINRDQIGSLRSGEFGVGFQQNNINIATLETSGVDFQAVYDLDLWDAGLEGWGSVRFDFAGTYLDELSTVSFPGASPVDCAGKVTGACGSPNPEWRHRMLTTWQTPWDISVNATWRYFSETDNAQGDNVSPFLDLKAERVQYLDLSLNWAASEQLEFRAGVNNVNGRDIPVITSAGPTNFGNGNTFPTVFDTSRFFFFGATYRL